MAEKTLNSRLIMKHDSAENWARATNFTPKKGEIIIYDGSGSTASKFKIGDGSTTVVNLPFAGGGSQAATGSATMPIYWDGTQYKTISSFPEKYLSWGGRNIVADISPVDAAMSYLHSSNKMQFANPEGITIEYSNNGGSTWTDYGATDAQKKGFVSGFNQNFHYGKHATDGTATVNDRLRITFDANACGIYTALKSVIINMSTDGSSGNRVIVEKSLIGSSTTFHTYGTYDISGWSGWNSLPIIITFGGNSTQTTQNAKLRFTFYCSSVTSTSNPIILGMMFFGTTNWSTPSNMANTGHIYSWTVNQDAIFPGGITATGFNGNASSANIVNGHTVNSDVPANAKFTDTVYSLPAATSSVLGGVKIGSGITVASDGTISAASSYTLPTASTSTKGGIKVGTGLTMSSETLNHSNSITAKTAYGSTATTASANGGSFTVTDVKYDAQGHITGSTDRKITLSQTTYTLSGLGGVPTSRKINGKALSADITLTASDVGAAASTALSSYLPLTGGTVSGNLTVGGTFTYTNIGSDNSTSDYFKLWLSNSGVPKRCDYLYFNPAEKMLAVQGDSTASPKIAVEALGSNTVSIALIAEATGSKGILNRVTNNYILQEIPANNIIKLAPSSRTANTGTTVDGSGYVGVNAAQWPQIAFNVVNSSGTSTPASMFGSLRSSVDTAESTFVRTYVSSSSYKDWYFTKDGNFIAPGNLYSAIGGTNYRVWNQYNMKSGTSLPASANAGDIFFLYS